MAVWNTNKIQERLHIIDRQLNGTTSGPNGTGARTQPILTPEERQKLLDEKTKLERQMKQANTVNEAVPAAARTVSNAVLSGVQQGLNNSLSNSRTAPESAYKRGQAEQIRQSGARAQGDAQRNYQIANVNIQAQGDREAAGSAAAQFSQRAAQLGGQAGAGAAALASMNVVDPTQRYDTLRARADQAHQRAFEQQTQAEQSAVSATGLEGEAAGDDYWYRNNLDRNAASNALSMGNDPNQQDGSQNNQQSPEQQSPEQQSPEQQSPEQQPPAQQVARVDAALSGLTGTEQAKQEFLNVYKLPKEQRAAEWTRLADVYRQQFANQIKGGVQNISTDITLGGKYEKYDLDGNLVGSDRRLKENIIKIVSRRF